MPLDFRLIAFISLFPDFVDNYRYVTKGRAALVGRLIAHILLFNVLCMPRLSLIRRDLWMYFLASLRHLLNIEGLALRQVFWPILDFDLVDIGIVGGV